MSQKLKEENFELYQNIFYLFLVYILRQNVSKLRQKNC